MKVCEHSGSAPNIPIHCMGKMRGQNKRKCIFFWALLFRKDLNYLSSLCLGLNSGTHKPEACVQCSGKIKETKTIALNRWEHVKHVAHEKTPHDIVKIWDWVSKYKYEIMYIFNATENTRDKKGNKLCWLFAQFHYLYALTSIYLSVGISKYQNYHPKFKLLNQVSKF